MYVECVGTSGAGKTVFAEKIRDVFEKNNISCVTRGTFFSSKKSKTYLLFWTLFRICYLDIVSIKLMFLLYHKKGLGVARTIRVVHEHLKLSYSLSHHQSQTAVVWDGGFVQRFANLNAMKLKDVGFISNFIKNQLPHETLLVFVDTSIEDAIIRRDQREIRLRSVVNRSMPSKSIPDREKEKEYLKKTKQAQIQIVDRLKEQGVSVLKVDGSVSPEKNASVIYEYIKNTL